METICIKMKLKDGFLKETREWFQNLKTRSNEVQESLENEGVAIESVFLDKHQDTYYLIYYMKAKSLAHAKEMAIKSTLSIDNYHKQCMRELCEEKETLEILMDFNNLEAYIT